MWQIKRTEGVSTTDIVGRMLMCSRDNVRFSAEDRERLTREFSMGAGPDTGAHRCVQLGGCSWPNCSGLWGSGSGSSISRGWGWEQHLNLMLPCAVLSTNSSWRHDQCCASSHLLPCHAPSPHAPRPACPPAPADSDSDPATPRTLGTKDVTVSRFMPTSRRIVQFSSGKSAPPGAKIVYIDGAFDLFHVGHVEILKVSRGQGS